MIKLRNIIDNDYQILYLANTTIESDHPIYLLVKVEYTDEWGDKPDSKYHVSIVAVGPQWPSDIAMSQACNSYGLTLAEFRQFPLEGQLELMIVYGIYATLYGNYADNKRKALKACRELIGAMSMLIGFHLDKPQNAIGNTGWDFLRGTIGCKKESNS